MANTQQTDEVKITKAEAKAAADTLLASATARKIGKLSDDPAYREEAKSIRDAYHDGETIADLVKRFGTMAVAGALGAVMFEYAVKPAATTVIEWFKG